MEIDLEELQQKVFTTVLYVLDKGVKSVPSTWLEISYNKLHAYWFPVGSKINEVEYIKNKTNPERDWPLLEVRVLGQSMTYDEAKVLEFRGTTRSDVENSEPEMPESVIGRRNASRPARYNTDTSPEREIARKSSVPTTNAAPTPISLPTPPTDLHLHSQDPKQGDCSSRETSRNGHPNRPRNNQNNSRGSQNRSGSTSNRQSNDLGRSEQPGGSSRSQQPGGSSRTQQPGGSSRSQQHGNSSRSQQPGGSSRTQQPSGSSRSQQPGGSSRTQQPGNSSRSQQPGGPSRTQQPGGSSRNQQPGGSSRNQQPGGSSRNQQPGGSSRTQQPGGSSRTQQPGGSSRIQQPGSSGMGQQRGGAGGTKGHASAGRSQQDTSNGPYRGQQQLNSSNSTNSVSQEDSNNISVPSQSSMNSGNDSGTRQLKKSSAPRNHRTNRANKSRAFDSPRKKGAPANKRPRNKNVSHDTHNSQVRDIDLNFGNLSISPETNKTSTPLHHRSITSNDKSGGEDLVLNTPDTSTTSCRLMQISNRCRECGTQFQREQLRLLHHFRTTLRDLQNYARGQQGVQNAAISTLQVTDKLTTKEELEKLEERMKDTDFFNAVVVHCNRIGGTTIKMCVKLILREVLSRDVALLYSLRGVQKKLPFCDLLIYRAVKVAIKQRIDSSTDKEIDKEIGIYLANSGDRDGNRNRRPRTAAVVGGTSHGEGSEDASQAESDDEREERQAESDDERDELQAESGDEEQRSASSHGSDISTDVVENSDDDTIFYRSDNDSGSLPDDTNIDESDQDRSGSELASDNGIDE